MTLRWRRWSQLIRVLLVRTHTHSTRAHTHTHTHTQHARTHTHTQHACTHAHTHSTVHTHTHTHTHTHLPRGNKLLEKDSSYQLSRTPRSDVRTGRNSTADPHPKRALSDPEQRDRVSQCLLPRIHGRDCQTEAEREESPAGTGRCTQLPRCSTVVAFLPRQFSVQF